MPNDTDCLHAKSLRICSLRFQALFARSSTPCEVVAARAAEWNSATELVNNVHTMDLKPYFEEMSILLKQVYRGLIDEVMQAVAVPINPQVEDGYMGSAVLFGPIASFYVKGRGGEKACSIVASVYCGHDKDITNGYDVQVGDRLMMFASVGMDFGREFLHVPPSIITVAEGEQWFAELKKKIDESFMLIASQGPAIVDGLNNFERYVEEDNRAAEEEGRRE